jgi:hypothetical protein
MYLRLVLHIIAVILFTDMKWTLGARIRPPPPPTTTDELNLNGCSQELPAKGSLNCDESLAWFVVPVSVVSPLAEQYLIHQYLPGYQWLQKCLLQ